MFTWTLFEYSFAMNIGIILMKLYYSSPTGVILLSVCSEDCGLYVLGKQLLCSM